MVKYVALFPGQGAQFPQMGLDLYDKYEKVRDLFTLAGDVTHTDFYNLLKTGEEEELQKTHNTQLLITLINRCCSVVVKEKNYQPVVAAGFSLGELSAYTEASMLDEETLFSLVMHRGTIMARHGEMVQKELGQIGMAAVMNLSFDKIDEIITQSNIKHIYAANDNSTSQVVVAGLFSSISQIEPLLKEAGAKRIIPLKVSGPFHTPLMEGAKIEFEEILKNIEFSDPTFPVYSNVHAKVVQSKDEAKELLAKQLTSPVRWSSIVTEVEQSYPTHKAIEVGPNKVLTGLFRSTNVVCYPSGSVGDIERIEKEMRDE
ncbi:MAG: ACP S-malonyltransferase [Spirochaetia bacterium]|nr:ACP S-malonyltransferase [Spirochaetia bacterium]